HRLDHVAGDDGYRARAEEILRLDHDVAEQNPFAYAAYLQARELYAEGPTEVVVVGAAGAPGTDALWRSVGGTYLPHRVLVAAEPGDPAPLAPARDRPAVDAHVTAYVCRHFTCSAPVTEPAALRQLLAPA